MSHCHNASTYREVSCPIISLTWRKILERIILGIAFHAVVPYGNLLFIATLWTEWKWRDKEYQRRRLCIFTSEQFFHILCLQKDSIKILSETGKELDWFLRYVWKDFRNVIFECLYNYRNIIFAVSILWLGNGKIILLRQRRKGLPTLNDCKCTH